MNAVIYCRVSSKEQVEGTSLESQQLACEEYARGKTIVVLRTFIEQGESAKFADRTQLLSLIDFCRENKGKVNLLLVWKVDRFARNVADHFSVKATLQKYGVKIVSVTEPIDSNPEGRLMETMLAGFAQFDNDIRAARTVQGMRRKIQEGIFPWKPPLGYKSSRRDREKKNRPDIPDQPLFGLLQTAWQQFATGTYTKAEIRRLMTTWGVVTRKGETITDQSIDHFFRNPYYAGMLIDPWSKEEYRGLHVPMVSAEDFAKVQQIISGRSRAVPHHHHRKEFPLKGLVRCSECKKYLTASFSRGRSRRYAYYHCYSRSCPRRAKGIRSEDVHCEFSSYLPRISLKPAIVRHLTEAVVTAAENREKFAKTRQNRNADVVGRLNRQLQELIKMRMERLITDQEFGIQRSSILSQRHAVQATPRPDLFTAEEIKSSLAVVIEPLKALKDTWAAMAQPVRSRFQRLIFPVGFAFGSIGTAEMGLLFRLFGRFADGESHEVTQEINLWNQIYQEIIEFSEVLRSHSNPERYFCDEVPRKTAS